MTRIKKIEKEIAGLKESLNGFCFNMRKTYEQELKNKEFELLHYKGLI